MKPVLFLLILLLMPLAALASSGSLPLLAVKESNGGFEGSRADLLLEIIDGTGRVFVDTFPLSKIDTQISMRFAKEIACDFIDKDCSGYDFIYTIRADSPIIGGPSAGAAATLLTLSVLREKSLSQKIAVTGTINSGGLVGPVGGLKEKITAAQKSGITKVLIPMGEEQVDNLTNMSFEEYGNKIGIEVVEVSDLNDILVAFGEKPVIVKQNISIEESYSQIMRSLAVMLCDRNQNLTKMIGIPGEGKELFDIYRDAQNLSSKAEKSFQNLDYYSAASYCFGSNVKLNQLFLLSKNFSAVKYAGLMAELRDEITDYEKQIDKKRILTITDLESYMIVKERLIEAMSYANTTQNQSFEYPYAYANERLRSAYAWSSFFNNQGKSLNFATASLKASCSQRISETEERLEYAALYIPFSLSSAKESLQKAYDFFEGKEYELCLFSASKAKAEANIVLNTIGVKDSYIPILIEKKLDAASRVILKAANKKMFPVLGYSYYEYANSLKETEPISALLYSEYALELSNLDMYFVSESRGKKVALPPWLYVLVGLAAGLVFGILLNHKPSKARTLLGKKR